MEDEKEERGEDAKEERGELINSPYLISRYALMIRFFWILLRSFDVTNSSMSSSSKSIKSCGSSTPRDINAALYSNLILRVVNQSSKTVDVVCLAILDVRGDDLCFILLNVEFGLEGDLLNDIFLNREISTYFVYGQMYCFLYRTERDSIYHLIE